MEMAITTLHAAPLPIQIYAANVTAEVQTRRRRRRTPAVSGILEFCKFEKYTARSIRAPHASDAPIDTHASCP